MMAAKEKDNHNEWKLEVADVLRNAPNQPGGSKYKPKVSS